MTAWSIASIPDLTEKTALVTGPTSGLGLATARVLAAKGARVILACRNAERGQALASELGAAAEVALVDLASLESVRACARSLAAKPRPIDILVNNAGVMATPLSKTAEGFEQQIGTNHLGHFAL